MLTPTWPSDFPAMTCVLFSVHGLLSYEMINGRYVTGMVSFLRGVRASQWAALYGVGLREGANTTLSPGSARRRAPQRPGRSGPRAEKDEAKLLGPWGGLRPRPATPRPQPLHPWNPSSCTAVSYAHCPKLSGLSNGWGQEGAPAHLVRSWFSSFRTSSVAASRLEMTRCASQGFLAALLFFSPWIRSYPALSY